MFGFNKRQRQLEADMLDFYRRAPQPPVYPPPKFELQVEETSIENRILQTTEPRETTKLPDTQTPGDVDYRLEIDFPTNVTTNVDFSITVTTLDEFGNVFESDGSVGMITTPSGHYVGPTTVQLVRGRATFNAKFDLAGTYDVKVQMSDNVNIADHEPITVADLPPPPPDPTTVTTLVLDTLLSQVAGLYYPWQVKAYNAANAFVNTYNTTLSIQFLEGNVQLQTNPAQPFTMTAGIANFQMRSLSSGSYRIRIVDIAHPNIYGESPLIFVN